MSGSANYKDGRVTAVNTAPTHASGMGGKQTIVNVTGGKGFEIGLDDINFVWLTIRRQLVNQLSIPQTLSLGDFFMPSTLDLFQKLL